MTDATHRGSGAASEATGRSGESTPAMGWNATFSMAVGGMIGGGIFSVLGVVISLAGSLAWLAFVIGGVIAYLTALSYIRLAAEFGQGGGAFTYLREMGRASLAGTLSWVLIAGYVLTTAVYAFTFGHYLSEVMGFGGLVARLLAVAAMVTLVGVNLLGVSESAGVEIFAVWVKLLVLGALAVIGLARWDPSQLATGGSAPSAIDAVIGAASVFVAYEGFQLLAYDYDDIEDPDRTLPRAVLPAVGVVTVVYVMVALGAAMLVGAPVLVEQKEVALAAAGHAAAGTAGKIAVSVAAALSAASAINATLFATARLSKRVADAGELPAGIGHQSAKGIPDRAVIALGAAGTLLAAVGSLDRLVEAASVTFLLTFAGVNVMAALKLERRGAAVAGAVAAGAAGSVALGRLALTDPIALALLVLLVAAAAFARPRLLAQVP